MTELSIGNRDIMDKNLKFLLSLHIHGLEGLESHCMSLNLSSNIYLLDVESWANYLVFQCLNFIYNTENIIEATF